MIEFDNVPVSLDAMLPKNGKRLHQEIKKACGLAPDIIGSDPFKPIILRKSVDARRKRDVHFVINIAVDLPQLTEADLTKLRCRKGVSARLYAPKPKPNIPDLSAFAAQSGYQKPVVVGAGPAGLFAALILARAGLRPIVIERGKPAAERLLEVEAFANGGKLDRNSNIQFGEGGAGTFSDGKLTTNTKSPYINYVLQEFVDAGADEDIHIDSKPHIGTDILPDVVTALRQKAEHLGAKFMFNTKLEDILLAKADDGAVAQRKLIGIKVANVITGEAQTIDTDTVFLAIGHSARDTFLMLKEHSIAMERKPFAVGVRIEHLQDDINRAQYGRAFDHPALEAADYKLAVRVPDSSAADGTRGVYTFCMCPGGTVVAASSEPDHLCVNGMSVHARDGRNSNSALLVEIKPDDLAGEDVLAGVEFQRQMENAAYMLGKFGATADVPENAKGETIDFCAPVQTVGDYMNGRFGTPSKKVVPTYPRGVRWTDLHECLPSFVSRSIQKALPKLDEKLEGFMDDEAVLTGVEPRSSSPVKIVRDKETLRSLSVNGLFPVGEGCGYAGGIMSAATDGIRCALAHIQAISDRLGAEQ